MTDSSPLSSPLIGMPSRRLFILELLLALLLTRIPYLSLPFNWLESYFHELSHALMTLFSGGIVSHIELYANGAGRCLSQGGWPVPIAFCGYFGAALWGGLIFNLATWKRGLRGGMICLGLGVLLSLLLWGRDWLTLAIMATLAALFLLPLKLTPGPVLSVSLRVMALMIMLNALASPAILLTQSHRGDAALLAQQTWVPAWVWVLLWLAACLGILWLCWRKVANARTNNPEKPMG